MSYLKMTMRYFPVIANILKMLLLNKTMSTQTEISLRLPNDYARYVSILIHAGLHQNLRKVRFTDTS